MRLGVEGGRIAEVETLVGQQGVPGPFAPGAEYAPDPLLSQAVDEAQSTRRRRMRGLVEDYFDTREVNRGVVRTSFSADCAHVLNGVSLTHGDYWSAAAAEGCQAQYAAGVWLPVDRIRDRRTPVVDVERGLVAAISYEDRAARYATYQTAGGGTLSIDIEYPNTRGLLEIFKIVDGEIVRIEGVSAFLPYFMPSGWAAE
jgi:hypothetical protein